MAKNVLGTELKTCSKQPMTGFYRNGCCDTGGDDLGMHTICVEVTHEFLEFARAQGNDLISPAPQYGFPGLVEGNRWCCCLQTVVDSMRAGKAPGIVLEATHISALEFVDLEALKMHAI